MKLNFIKVSPAQNMTIFVMDKVDSSQHMIVANRLMKYSNINSEQVAFIEEPRSIKGKSLNTLRLQMMGGEFCGNSSRSLAALMVHLNLSSISKLDDTYNVILEVSGTDELINCQVRNTNRENIYYSKIEMPLPNRVSNTNVAVYSKRINLNRVDLPGITHFIVDSNEVNDQKELFNIIKAKMDKEDYKAFGIMYYDYDLSYLTPFVYVKATDSSYWEKSCATGTAALGVALALNNNISLDKKVKQPGGELDIRIILEEEKISKIFLDGTVEVVAEGIVFIDDQL